LDRTAPSSEDNDFSYYKFNLTNEDFSIFNKFMDIDTLVISAGFGRVASFDTLTEKETINSFKVNYITVIRIIKIFYDKICNSTDFYCP